MPTATGVAPAPSHLHRGGLPPATLNRVRQYIEKHLEEGVSLKELAAIGRLSLSHFGRAFKQSEGVSPYDYLLGCRVRRAQQLLAGTEMRLAEIAVACGFADQSHFTRTFRRLVGVPPSAYARADRYGSRGVAGAPGRAGRSASA